MCGGGGYAGMTKKLLVSLGWDENKIYNVGDQEKRVIQLLVKTNIEGNKAPVKAQEIEVSLPQYGDFKPEEVIVIGNTKAANGKTLDDDDTLEEQIERWFVLRL